MRCLPPLQSKAQIRKYIRHPSDVPIEVQLDWVSDSCNPHPCDELQNISLGGLAFKSPQGLPIGQNVHISFPLLDQNESLLGSVVWNRKLDDGYEIGLRFQDEAELFRLRMIEQVCHIEHYRKEVAEHEGRELSSEQAALEWIQHFAGDFPGMS